MDNSKSKVIVLSRNYSTGLGVIRSLGAAGYSVDLIASVKQKGSSRIISGSKYVQNSVEVLSENIQTDSGEKLIYELMKYADKDLGKIVAFPTDDFTTSVIDMYREQLEPFFLMPRTKDCGFTLRQLMDKTLQGQMASEAGLLTPREWLVSLEGRIIIPEDMIYPCFVKPLQSITGHKTEMKKCDDETSLIKHLHMMQKSQPQRNVLIQEYLNISKEYDLSGVCNDQEVTIPAVIEKTRIAQFERGVTMTGQLVDAGVLGSALDKIKNLLKKIHYTGMFDIELNLCGDNLYFNEINLRSGGPNYAYFLNGVNLPALCVQYLLCQDTEPMKKTMDSYGTTFVYEKVAWEDYIHGYMNKRELKRCICDADFTLLEDETDPKPGRIFSKRIRLSEIKQRVKKHLKKRPEAESCTNLTDGKNRVLVIGRNYCNILTMCRALGTGGYSVDVVRLHKKTPSRLNPLQHMKPEAYSKYANSFSECIVGLNEQNVLETLKAFARNDSKTLLIPVDDYTAGIIDHHFNELRKNFILPNIADTQNEICRMMNKQVQKEIAAQFGLPLLNSIVIKSKERTFSVPEEINYPCFVKPNMSINGQKAKMVKCENRTSLEALLKKFSENSDFEVLVEDFVDIKTEYAVLGLATPDAVIAPALFKTIVGGHRERKGVAVTGEIKDTDLFDELIEKCKVYIKELQYTGIFDIDFIESKDGKLYFVEVNFRAGASIYAFTKAGVNLPKTFADYCLKDMDIDENCKIKEAGLYFVSEKVLLEEYIRGDISLSEAREMMKNADICFIHDEQDKAPYSHFCKFFTIAMALKLPYRIFK